MRSDWAAQIVRYWFEELHPRRGSARTSASMPIRERFGALHEELAQIRPEQLATPLECRRRDRARPVPAQHVSRLAARVRNGPAGAGNRAASHRGGTHQQLTPQQRLFLYMPFQHSEDRAVQARPIELFTQLGDRDNLGYAHRHKEVIDRFGRFPHRNEVLGRESTPEEVQYVATHRGFY